MPDINVVIFQNDKWWVAQCLQYDIGAQADSPIDVMYELERSLVGHVAICTRNHREPFADLPAAPQNYWDMWEGAKIKLQYEDAAFRAPSPSVRPKDVRMAMGRPTQQALAA